MCVWEEIRNCYLLALAGEAGRCSVSETSPPDSKFWHHEVPVKRFIPQKGLTSARTPSTFYKYQISGGGRCGGRTCRNTAKQSFSGEGLCAGSSWVYVTLFYTPSRVVPWLQMPHRGHSLPAMTRSGTERADSSEL